ncbi:MAG: hypothetical protein RIS35_2659 [Pseudomonadota bacterium]|jgi:hypothetical protein
MSETLIIERRFNGPVASGNGGWVGGALARRMPTGAVSVSLRSPPPLERELRIAATPEAGLELRDGSTVLALAEPATLDLATPSVPDLESARAAGAMARMRARSRAGEMAYAMCFGCGIDRHDGLGIVPGPVGEEGVVAACWTPSADLAETDGSVRIEAVWAALDCPAGSAWSHRLNLYPSMMTVRMTAVIDAPLTAGRPYGVMGWPIERDGRKLHAGTAIFDGEGRVLARSLQLWLLPRD